MKTVVDEESILESIATLIDAILPLSVLDKHKRAVINTLLWKLTEARGKYKTRYCSSAA